MAPDLVRRVGLSKRFHPLWAGLSFQSKLVLEAARTAPDLVRFPSPLGGSQFSKLNTKRFFACTRRMVSIPFGRVSVFKVYSFDPPALLALRLVSIPFGRVSVFKGSLTWAWLSVLCRFPSPLGGSQFSKSLLKFQHPPMPMFPSPLGGSQFSKPQPPRGLHPGAFYFSFHPLWAGLSFQSGPEHRPILPGRVEVVSIPFGRVSVFKAIILPNPALYNLEAIVSIPFGRVSVFKGELLGREPGRRSQSGFPSPLGGSQFSKHHIH